MLKKIGIIPDCHAPYHDKRAVSLVQKVFRDIGLDYLVILGDFVDAAPISTHSKDPTRVLRWKQERDSARKLLAEFRAVSPRAKRHFVEGNHEWRLMRYLHDKAPELAGLDELSIESQLNLKELGYQFTPYKQFLKLGHVHYTHDTGKAGTTAIRSARDDFEGNVVIGHVHSMGSFYSGNARGKTRVGMSFGWLGSHEAADYMQKLHVNRNWQLGFGLGFMEPSGVTHLTPVPIINYKCVVNGKMFKG